MLVYLDSSHIAELDRLLTSDRKSFDSFLDTWRRRNAVLAFSLHHAQEIAQLGNLDSINRRLSVLGAFGEIQIALKGWDGVIDLELQEQLLGLSRNTQPQYKEVRHRLFTPSNLEEIRGSVVTARETFLKLREGLLLVAKAENLSKEAKAESSSQGVYTRLISAHKDPEKEFPRDFDWDTWIREMTDFAAKGQASDNPGAVLFQWLFSQLLAAVRQEGSIRGGLEAFMGLKGLSVLEIAPLQDLAALQGYYAQAREVASTIAHFLGVEVKDVLKRIRELQPYDSPAFRLRVAYDRARKRAPKPSEPGDQVDSDHLAYAPYVDIAFADKRTWEYVQQEARRGSALLSVQAVANIKRVRNVHGVLEEIAGWNPG